MLLYLREVFIKALCRMVRLDTQLSPKCTKMSINKSKESVDNVRCGKHKRKSKETLNIKKDQNSNVQRNKDITSVMSSYPCMLLDQLTADCSPMVIYQCLNLHTSNTHHQKYVICLLSAPMSLDVF